MRLRRWRRRSDWLIARGRKDAGLVVSVFPVLAAAPFGVMTLLAPTPTLALVGLAGFFFIGAMPSGLATLVLQLFTPNRLRAQVAAIYYLILSLVAGGIGPVAVGLMTDYVFEDPLQLRYSLLCVSSLALLVSAGSLFVCRGKLSRSMRLSGEGW